jgi:hypothetical protein
MAFNLPPLGEVLFKVLGKWLHMVAEHFKKSRGQAPEFEVSRVPLVERSGSNFACTPLLSPPLRPELSCIAVR